MANWIKGAIKHPGLLTRQAKAAGKSLSEFEAEKHKSTKINREIALAKTLATFHHKAK